MQSIEEKIYEGFWDKNIARMINRADLFSFLKQYVNPGLLTKSSKPELVHDLKEYMTTDNLEFIAEATEWAQRAKKLTKEDIDKMFEKNDMKSNVNTEKSNMKNDDCKIGGHVVPDNMAKNFGAVEVDGAADVPDHTWDEEAEMKKDTDRFHVLA